MIRVACMLAAITVALVLASQSHAAEHARAPVVAAEPTGTCDFTHRMDIEIIDGVWHECMCLALTMGWDCGWVRLPDPAVVSIRLRVRRHHSIRTYMPRAWVTA